MGRTLPRLKSAVSPLVSSGIPPRTEIYSKWWRAYVEIPNGRNSQNDCNGEKGHPNFALPVEHDGCCDYRRQCQYPIDRKHGVNERPCRDRTPDARKYCVGFDLRCSLPTLSIICEVVRARYNIRGRGEITRSSATDFERDDRYGFIRGPVDNEGEC